jgi:hypothetical protein
MIEAAFTVFQVPKELDVDPELADDCEEADALIQFLVRLAARRFTAHAGAGALGRDPPRGGAGPAVLHDCEDCQHATLAARTALRADPFASVAIDLIRLDERLNRGQDVYVLC